MTHLFLIAALLLLAACGTTPGEPFSQTLNVALTPQTRPISDVEGPYGGVAMQKHAVAVRVWPDQLEDGYGDASVIVTNGGWNTIHLSVDDLSLMSAGEPIEILDRDAVFAALGDEEGSTSPAEAGIAPLTERGSSRAVRVQQGAMTGSRQSGDVEGVAMDPAVVDAARRASASRRSAGGERGGLTLEAQREAVADWYLQTLEIYPGDTATGGISFQLPGRSQDLQLTVDLDGEIYTFDLRYIRTP